MSKYIVMCTGSAELHDPLRHDRCQVALIDDDRATGGDISVVGAWGFEDMFGMPSGNRTFRLRCAACGWDRNVFLQKNTLGELLDNISAAGAELGVVKLPYLPPELESRTDAEHLREQIADWRGERVEDAHVIPFTALDRMVQLLKETP